MKTNHKIIMTLLVIISITALSIISATYSRFVYKQSIQKTITVPEYNHCLANGITNLNDCILVNEANYLSVDAATSAISLKTVDYTTPSTTDEGLLKTTDNDGETYYFRGAADDNYIQYAGHIWRIIRVNGDGSTRIFYAGATPDATGSATAIGISKYNDTTDIDMTYVGYKYGLSKEFKATTLVGYDNIKQDVEYSFGTSYTCDELSKTCTIDGTITTGLWSDVYKTVTSEMENVERPAYTCWQSDPTTSCNIITFIGINTLPGSTTPPTAITVNYLGYISTSYESTLTNVYDSTIKTTIDNWYIENILLKNDSNNISYANYLSDSGFCTDRSLGVGDGNTLMLNTVYGAYRRNATSKEPSLMCGSNIQDLLTVENTGYGTLTYPIGLITADEITMSGVITEVEAASNYLDTGINFWTMSPAYFKVNKLTSTNFIYGRTKILQTHVTNSGSHIRPVVNLSPNVKVTRGNGTISNPYQITLN